MRGQRDREVERIVEEIRERWAESDGDASLLGSPLVEASIRAFAEHLAAYWEAAGAPPLDRPFDWAQDGDREFPPIAGRGRGYVLESELAEPALSLPEFLEALDSIHSLPERTPDGEQRKAP